MDPVKLIVVIVLITLELNSIILSYYSIKNVSHQIETTEKTTEAIFKKLICKYSFMFSCDCSVF